MFYTRSIKYILRILNVSISSYLAYLSFDLFYKKFMTYVPIINTLDLLNTQVGTGLTSLLRENSLGYREMYYHAYEKSLLFSFVVFVSGIILIEYIYRARDREILASSKRIWEAVGAWKERNILNNSNISNEHSEYLKDFFKKE